MGIEPTSASFQPTEYTDFPSLNRRGWKIAAEYVDNGISGAKDSRPALDRLFVDARRRKFDGVLVYRYDRFARSLRQLVGGLSEFDALGIHFVSLHEGVDTSTPNGRLCLASSHRSRNLSASSSGRACVQAWPRRVRAGNGSVDRGASWTSAELRRCAHRASAGSGSRLT
jgi:hypothetical protein